MTAAAAVLLASLWAMLPIHYQLAHRPLLHARGLWQLTLLVGGAVVAAERGEWWLAAMAAWFVWRWRAPELYPVLGVWLGIAATWVFALAVPAWGWDLIEASLAGVGLALALVTLHEWQHKARPQAWLGQRMALGGFAALLMAVLPLWAWVFLALPFWLAGPAWSAVLALAVAVAWRWPVTLWAWPTLGILVGVGIRWRAGARAGWLERWTPRGDSLDSLRLRLVALLIGLSWLRRREVLTHGTWGLTPARPVAEHLRVYTLRLVKVPRMDSFHCEPLQHVVEFGVLGAVALVAFAVRVGAHLTVGDPWSAAALAGTVLMGTTIAGRVAPLGLLWLVVCARVVTG